MPGHNFQQLQQYILARSNSRIWDEAKSEWELEFVYQSGDRRSCVCEHYYILNICVIKNKDNKNVAQIGNTCVHKFKKTASNKVLSAFRKVISDPLRSFNPAALELCVRRGVIPQAEHDDYILYWRKTVKITVRQKAQKADINTRIVSWIVSETQRLEALFLSQGIEPRS